MQNLSAKPAVSVNQIHSRRRGPRGEGEQLRGRDASTTQELTLGSVADVPPSATLEVRSQDDFIPSGTIGRTSIPTREAAVELMRNFMLQQDIESLLAEDILIPSELLHPTIIDPQPFAAGRPWAKREVKSICFFALPGLLRHIADDIEDEHRKHIKLVNSGQEGTQGEVELPSRFLPVIIKKHLVALAQIQDVEEAWRSYTSLIDFITCIPSVYRHLPHIPFAHLHRLTRLLAGNRPKTHRQYLRLLAVLTYLKHSGGTIMQYQYNALVDHAGKGWRKTREEEVLHAKRIAKDLEIGRLPGLSEEAYEFENEDYAGLNPDIYTYTTLLATAARASNTRELLNISSLMQKAGLPPNRITHLTLLRYFTQNRNLGGVRSTLQKMRYQNLELGLDGLNACMWAYGRNGKIDIAWMIYRLLCHNAIAETYVGEGDVDEVASELADEYIFVESEIQPNEITFTMLIQMMAYLGHFQAALDVFQDMLTFRNKEHGAPLYADETGVLQPSTYRPTVAVYRNLFLGFSKHGVPVGRESNSVVSGWTLDNLRDLFKRFLDLPPRSSVTYANVDIIMKAFSLTSRDDPELMRNVWMAIEERFGPIMLKPSSSNRMTRLQMKLFPEKFSDKSTRS